MMRGRKKPMRRRARRAFTPEQKLAILNEYNRATIKGKVRVLDKYDIETHHISAWRQQFRRKAAAKPATENKPGPRVVKNLLDVISPDMVDDIIPGMQRTAAKPKRKLVTVDLETFNTLADLGLSAKAALDGSMIKSS